MKIKLTPLFVIAVCTLIVAVIVFFESLNESMGAVVAIAIGGVGILATGVYFVLRLIFPTRVKLQMFAEIVAIAIFCLCYYDFTKPVVLRAPANFVGYVILVYGIDHQPLYKNGGLLSKNTDVTIPKSGILFTSTPYNNGENLSFSIVDSLNGRANTLLPGYGIPYIIDTLICGNKKYTMSIAYLHAADDWYFSTDTANRRIKKEEACRMLSK